MNDQEQLEARRQLWDKAAADFDNEADHGLRDPIVRAAWRDFLARWLPQTPRRILDIGCGTGSLSLIMAEFGHEVTGIDLSPAMIAQAQAKAVAAGQQITFQVMDAAYPQFMPHQFETIICRHVLWALPQPDQVLERWVKLLAPGGRFVLIEGFWHTGAGLHAQDIVNALPAAMTNIFAEKLSDNSKFWGAEVNDERYAIVADKLVTATA